MSPLKEAARMLGVIKAARVKIVEEYGGIAVINEAREQAIMVRNMVGVVVQETNARHKNKVVHFTQHGVVLVSGEATLNGETKPFQDAVVVVESVGRDHGVKEKPEVYAVGSSFELYRIGDKGISFSQAISADDDKKGYFLFDGVTFGRDNFPLNGEKVELYSLDDKTRLSVGAQLYLFLALTTIDYDDSIKEYLELKIGSINRDPKRTLEQISKRLSLLNIIRSKMVYNPELFAPHTDDGRHGVGGAIVDILNE